VWGRRPVRPFGAEVDDATSNGGACLYAKSRRSRETMAAFPSPASPETTMGWARSSVSH
jgi:hypothetical protein